MRAFSLIVVLFATASAAFARPLGPSIPLPRSRPAPTEIQAPEAQIGPSACERRLGERALFVALPAISGPGACGASDVVRLDAIIMPDHSHVAFTPPPTLRCSMAEAVADWVRADLGPALSELGGPLHAIENYDSYDCRGMNRVVGARISEHGKANALDIRSFKLRNGKVVRPTEQSVSRAFREDMRQTACARFMTVLGPGSDGYHEEHIHVDLSERPSGYRICHWDIHVPAEAQAIPLPRPRPYVTAAGQRF